MLGLDNSFRPVFYPAEHAHYRLVPTFEGACMNDHETISASLVELADTVWRLLLLGAVAKLQQLAGYLSAFDWSTAGKLNTSYQLQVYFDISAMLEMGLLRPPFLSSLAV